LVYWRDFNRTPAVAIFSAAARRAKAFADSRLDHRCPDRFLFYGIPLKLLNQANVQKPTDKHFLLPKRVPNRRVIVRIFVTLHQMAHTSTICAISQFHNHLPDSQPEEQPKCYSDTAFSNYSGRNRAFDNSG